MEKPMDSWNDDRLDELSGRVDSGFKETREGLAQVDQRFAQIDQRFGQVASREEMGEVRSELRRVNDRLDKLMLVIFTTCVGIFGTVLAGMLGLVLQA